MMRKIILLFLTAISFAQVSVVLAPNPQFDSVTVNGSANANGCVFTYISGTTTPLATYTDSTGTTQNANPVVLNASGSANIWIQAGLAYTFLVKTFGGVNCATGTTVYSVNGIAGGSSQAITVVPFSGTPTFTAIGQYQIFKMTLTGNVTSSTLNMTGVLTPSIISFELTQDGTGGRTFVWPINVSNPPTINSAANSTTTASFLWDGTTAFPWASAFGTLSVGALSLSGVVNGNLIQANSSLNIVDSGVPANQVVRTIFKTAVGTTHTGDTTTDTIYTIPLSALNANTQLRIRMSISVNVQGAGITNLIASFGGSGGITVSMQSSTWATLNFEEIVIANQNSVSSQVSTEDHHALTSIFQVNGGTATSAVNTGVATNLTIALHNANTTDSQTFNWVTVEEMP